MWRSTGFESTSWLFSCVLKDLREVSVRERAICLPLHSAERPRVRWWALHRQELLDLSFVLLDGNLSGMMGEQEVYQCLKIRTSSQGVSPNKFGDLNICSAHFSSEVPMAEWK